MIDVVDASGDTDLAANLSLGVETLRSVHDEPWAAALHLETQYIPQFEMLPPDLTADQMAAVQAMVGENLLLDPADFLRRVEMPIVAVFGENDVAVDSERSAALYEQYLGEAGNDDVTISVLPDVGHDIHIGTPGYWSLVSEWLAERVDG